MFHHSGPRLSPGPYGLRSTFVPPLNTNQTHARSSPPRNLLHSSKSSKSVIKPNAPTKVSCLPPGSTSGTSIPSRSPSLSTPISGDPTCYDGPLAMRSASVPSPCTPNIPENPTVQSMEDILSDLKPFLKRRAGGNQISMKGVTSEAFEKLQIMADEGHLEGWAQARIDYSGTDVIVRFPTLIHEAISHMFSKIPHELISGVTFHCGEQTNASYGGGDSITLSDGGQKTPDFVIYDQHHTPNDLTHLPTIAWEVGYSESAKNLGRDAARLVAGTGGGIQLAIAVKIEDDEERKLKAVTIDFWELTDSEQLKPSAGKELDVNRLIRADSLDDSERIGKASLAAEYQYIFYEKAVDLYWKYVVSRTERHQLIPGGPEGNRQVNILQRHVFRTIPEGTHGDDPAISIPYELFLDVIQRHTEWQRERDSAHKTQVTKRQLEDTLETARQRLKNRQEETRKRKKARLEEAQ